MPQASVRAPQSTDTTGQIHSDTAFKAPLMFARLGSAWRTKCSARFSAATIPGRPNTAKARLDQPFGSPFTPQCVTIFSGRRS